MPTSAASRPRLEQRVLQLLRDDDPGHLVVQPQREPVARHREDPGEHRDRPAAAEHLGEAVEHVEVEDDLRHRELRAGLELLAEALGLEPRGRRRSG